MSAVNAFGETPASRAASAAAKPDSPGDDGELRVLLDSIRRIIASTGGIPPERVVAEELREMRRRE